MLGRDEDDVMGAFSRNDEIGEIKRLSVNVTIHVIRKQLSKGIRINVREV